MLFLGWLLAAFLVVGAINLYLRFFGLPRSRKGLQGNLGKYGTSLKLSNGEGCQWLNSALSWLYLHYDSTPELIESWIRALNEQAKKHNTNNGLQMKFEKVQSGSLPPKVTTIQTDPASKDALSLYAGIEMTDTTLLVSAMQNTATNLKVTACDVNIIRLLGQVRIHGDHNQEAVNLTLTFAAPPEIKLNVSTRNYDTTIDRVEVERVVRAALEGAIVSITVSTRDGYLSYASPGHIDSMPLQNRNAMSTGMMGQERRLLVKVIKANGLGDRDYGCTDPYCTVQMDVPPQTHTTSVVKNTVNPFWDEHFLFDFDSSSKQVKFEVYDREKPTGDDFLGRALISLDELRRLPSSRQIVPLTGCSRATTTTSGSITVEFTFVDPSEVASLNMPNSADAISPRRRIETNTRVTPGGTYVTTTTTTTEKQRDHRSDAFYNDSPNMIERPNTQNTNYNNAEYSPYNTNTSRGSSHLEAHDAALSASPEHSPIVNGSEGIAQTALRDLKGKSAEKQKAPSKTSTLIITSVQRDPMPVPVIKMQEAGPQRDEGRDTLSMSTTSDMSKDKKKSTFASAFKKRFSRPKKRSQSADRAYSSSFKESSLLKPPEYGDPGPHSKTAEDLDHEMMMHDRGNLRKSRSNSFSSSLKRIFKKKKKDGTSRESSLSRASEHQASREGSVSHASPYTSYREGEYNRQPSPESDYNQKYSYSSSMPASASPLSYAH